MSVHKLLTFFGITTKRCFHSCYIQYSTPPPSVRISDAARIASPGKVDVALNRMILSQKTEVNGVQLHYNQCGNGNHAVLLIPGALGCSYTDFAPQVDNLNKDLFTLVAMDPRGYGESIPPERDWPVHFLQRDAMDGAKLMENLGHKKYSVVGWSDGGSAAIIIAATFPDNIKRLAFWGSNAYITENDLKLFESVREIELWSERMRKPYVDMYGKEYFQTQWNLWVEAYTRYMIDRQGDICKDDLKNVQCPTLIFHGEQDPLVPIEHPQYMLSNIRGSRLYTFPEGKHNVHLNMYREFNSILESFLIEP